MSRAKDTRQSRIIDRAVIAKKRRAKRSRMTRVNGHEVEDQGDIFHCRRCGTNGVDIDAFKRLPACGKR